MAISPISALNAYAAAARAGQGAPGGASGAGGASPLSDFAALLENTVTGAEQKLNAAEQLSAQAAVGKAELVDVVTAIAAAETSLETMLAVRDEVIRAYQDILRMPI